ncbi:hypothetical protein ACJ72_08782, partial [Emergomyces africanus]
NYLLDLSTLFSVNIIIVTMINTEIDDSDDFISNNESDSDKMNDNENNKDFTDKYLIKSIFINLK